MEKLRNVYFYIDTKAYVANAALKADPEVVERFYQESREALWDIGFGTGKDWAQKENEMLFIGVMAISGNIRAETIPELEQTLKTGGLSSIRDITIMETRLFLQKKRKKSISSCF